MHIKPNNMTSCKAGDLTADPRFKKYFYYIVYIFKRYVCTVATRNTALIFWKQK